MLVNVGSIEDFKATLESEESKNVHRQMVYVSLSYKAEDDQPKREVFLHVSCVVNVSDEEQYQLNYNQNFGIDYVDATQELKGTEAAEAVILTLRSWLEGFDLIEMPGVVDMR